MSVMGGGDPLMVGLWVGVRGSPFGGLRAEGIGEEEEEVGAE